MKRVTVKFDIDVPDSATDSEIDALVSFHVGAAVQLAGDNPMADQDLDAVSGSVWLR